MPRPNSDSTISGIASLPTLSRVGRRRPRRRSWRAALRAQDDGRSPAVRTSSCRPNGHSGRTHRWNQPGRSGSSGSASASPHRRQNERPSALPAPHAPQNRSVGPSPAARRGAGRRASSCGTRCSGIGVGRSPHGRADGHRLLLRRRAVPLQEGAARAAEGVLRRARTAARGAGDGGAHVSSWSGSVSGSVVGLGCWVVERDADVEVGGGRAAHEPAHERPVAAARAPPPRRRRGRARRRCAPSWPGGGRPADAARVAHGDVDAAQASQLVGQRRGRPAPGTEVGGHRHERAQRGGPLGGAHLVGRHRHPVPEPAEEVLGRGRRVEVGGEVVVGADRRREHGVEGAGEAAGVVVLGEHARQTGRQRDGRGQVGH